MCVAVPGLSFGVQNLSCSKQDLVTRDQTWAPCTGSKVFATGPPRKPLQVIFNVPHWYALTRQWNQSPHTNIFIGRLKISDKEMLEHKNLKAPVSAWRL